MHYITLCTQLLVRPMTHRKILALWLCFACLSLTPELFASTPSPPTTVLYNRVIANQASYPELILSHESAQFSEEGLRIRSANDIVKLNHYYALADRQVRYHVRFTDDAKAVFRSDQGDFSAHVDMENKRISIGTNPVMEKSVGFLNANHEYIVEIARHYQTSSVTVIDLFTGDSATLEATMNGAGGVGAGALGESFYVGLQHDYYCFGLTAGTELLVKQITVLASKCDVTLLLYGDSITEPEGYFPTADYPNSWTQLIMNQVPGGAMSSGRGGTTIQELLNRIKNELPYIRAKYVMVTIGTNGGNTEENLSELVEYIQSQGSIPILNNIPANESGTQVPENALIERVRQQYNIKGCKFDIATSIAQDGLAVDTTTMYFEDYSWGKIYHHPNAKGSKLMYLRTLIDVPEIYQ